MIILLISLSISSMEQWYGSTLPFLVEQSFILIRMGERAHNASPRNRNFLSPRTGTCYAGFFLVQDTPLYVIAQPSQSSATISESW